MEVNLLYYTKGIESPMYTFEVNGISTKTLMATSRHQDRVHLTVQSSRYTMKKSLNGESPIEESFSHGPDGGVNALVLKHMQEIVEYIKDNPKVKNDDLNMALPQGYKYNLVMTLSYESLSHMYLMRNNHTNAHWDIKEMIELIWGEMWNKAKEESTEAISTEKVKELCTEPWVVARAIRKCYSTEDKSDNGGPKDLKLINTVGVISKHASVLRHGTIVVDTKHLSCIKTIDILRDSRFTYNSGKLIVTNLQQVLEMDVSISKKMEILPDYWHYLIKNGEENE